MLALKKALSGRPWVKTILEIFKALDKTNNSWNEVLWTKRVLDTFYEVLDTFREVLHAFGEAIDAFGEVLKQRSQQDPQQFSNF